MNMQPTRVLPFLASLAVIAAIALIVFAAIEAGALLALIFGVVLLGVVAIGLAKVGVDLFSRWSDAKVRIDGARYDFIQNMAAKGALPNDGSFVPLHRQIAAPEEPDGAVLTESETEQYRQLALELVGVTYQKCGMNTHQLIPFNKCAVDGIEPFNDVKKWTGAKNWLLNHGLAYKEMSGDKCIATLFSNGMTVGDVYKRLVR